jgi:hypothetical protein
MIAGGRTEVPHWLLPGVQSPSDRSSFPQAMRPTLVVPAPIAEDVGSGTATRPAPCFRHIGQTAALPGFRAAVTARVRPDSAAGCPTDAPNEERHVADLQFPECCGPVTEDRSAEPSPPACLVMRASAIPFVPEGDSGKPHQHRFSPLLLASQRIGSCKKLPYCARPLKPLDVTTRM